MLVSVSTAVTPRGLASIVRWRPPLASLPTRITKWTMPFAVRTSGGGQALTTGWLSKGRYVDVALWLDPAATGTIRLRLSSRVSGRANRLLAFIETSSILCLNRPRRGDESRNRLSAQNARDRSSCQGRVASHHPGFLALSRRAAGITPAALFHRVDSTYITSRST